MSDANFAQRSVTVAGNAVAYAEAGSGEVLVCLCDEGGPSKAHALIAARRRVIAFTNPKTGTATPQSVARTVAAAIDALGIERFDVMGHGAATAAALWLTLEKPTAIGALALVAPTALADGNAELERRLGDVKQPTLALFGTNDKAAPPESGDRYRALLPDCHLMFVYDAAHAIDADRPDALAYIVLEFFERRDLFLVSRDSGIVVP